MTGILSTTPKQMNLAIEREVEIDGIGLGVLSDGRPYLTARGLARLCDVDHTVIVRLAEEWREDVQKPRINTIRNILEANGGDSSQPFIIIDGRSHWIDEACTAVLEYYAFEAGTRGSINAQRHFRTLARQGFKNYVYKQLGYSEQDIVGGWKQFHDRVSLVYNSVPSGYFSIFKEIADMIVTFGENGLYIDHSFVPDISVGLAWGKHWKDHTLDNTYGQRRQYEHNFPEDFPQAASNPQSVWCYPEDALGEFRRWFRNIYVGKGKLKNYLQRQTKAQALPATFTERAIEAYEKLHELEHKKQG